MLIQIFSFSLSSLITVNAQFLCFVFWILCYTLLWKGGVIMTDNEKRAHDLAIVICTDVCHLKRQSQVDAGKTHVTVDYFEEYINAYESALEAFNEKYPSDK